MLASDTKSTCNTQTQNQHLTEIQVLQTESLSSKWVKEETIIVFLAAPLLNRSIYHKNELFLWRCQVSLKLCFLNLKIKKFYYFMWSAQKGGGNGKILTAKIC